MALPNIDDMKLTAYALGELDDADRANAEIMLRNSAFARRYVQSVRAMALQLSEELAGETVEGLTAIQRASLEQRIGQAAAREPAAVRTHRRWNRAVLAGCIAASILIVGTSAALMLPPLYRQFSAKPDERGAVGHVPYIITDGTAPVSSLPGAENLPSPRPVTPKIDTPEDAAAWTGSARGPNVNGAALLLTTIPLWARRTRHQPAVRS